MTVFDYSVLVLYAAGMLLIGSILSRWNRSAADMFAVSRQSTWWLSGISAFMSAFSAGTFVVWGGIAYKDGLVSVSILMCLGISSFLVGRFLAARWARLGVTTAGEYVKIRFGEDVAQFYTWVGMLFKLIAMSVALYAFATLFCTVVELPEGNFFRDPATGHLSITWACVASGVLMLVYTVSGGLWAVLIIDAIQFVILTVTVLFVVPLCFREAGGVQAFLDAAPEGFLSPSGGRFTFLFLAGWIVVHVFKLGGEWVFIQRFLSVDSPRSARRSSYLVGVLYMVCPLIWMLPAMIFRVIEPGANPEQAYFLACAAVLPAGMMGLLLASMFSAAASSVGGEVNVYAGALTNDFYKALVHPSASERELVRAGRIFAFLIGAAIIAGAAAIPYVGGAESVILTFTSLLVVPMALPSIWGLLRGRIDRRALWTSMALSFTAAVALKILSANPSGSGFLQWLADNSVALEVGVGVFVPMLTLAVFELSGRRESEGFREIQKLTRTEDASTPRAQIALFPARLLAYGILSLAALMFSLAFVAEGNKLLVAGFGLVLAAIGAAILISLKRINREK